MKEINLFKTKGAKWISNHDILKSLEEVKAHDSQVLYIHTELNFGYPNLQILKKDLLIALLEVIDELKVPTIIMPTYTFSFCNKEDYDVLHSKTKMGLLNNFFRKQDGVSRSIDPLMSIAAKGEKADFFVDVDHSSIGEGSTFDKIHNFKGARFLFFGARMGDCFTYMHYLEGIAKVPYRYNRSFTGKIITPAKTYKDTYDLFVRYKGVIPGNGSYVYEDLLLKEQKALKAKCGDSFITSIDEVNATKVYLELLKSNPDYFLKHPFDESQLDKTFDVTNMVAL